ncbi:MAG: hypothetical protein QNJ60_11150 [Xenococcaceae cyanobacterium MO_188.B19]|nr:hypothetical protein [Xenococcaceae cyanobacterium MO_188.B19]
MLLAVPLEHPFSQSNSVHLADLEGETLIERTHCEIWRAEPHISSLPDLTILFTR